ncbi:hypothetical protein GWJ21_07915 [Bacillus coagulans]|uniref:DUF5085 family protein n=1 Tax=Heyndrickxia coagulans TaxID=1398 RepID=UPI001377F260|nr:DUF5085 family protein [Heyndrickxia coagulans]NCG67879.1 hypothetical protein [Heyndrickxia coagulans]
MKIEKRPLLFDNVLVYETTQLKEDWTESYLMMEGLPLLENVYQNGPVFFSVAPVEGEEKFGHFTFYLPINLPVQTNNEKPVHFQERFELNNALCLRQADEELDFYAAYEKVKKYAEKENIKLKDIYYIVLLEVFDDVLIDLYVPIEEELS